MPPKKLTLTVTVPAPAIEKLPERRSRRLAATDSSNTSSLPNQLTEAKHNVTESKTKTSSKTVKTSEPRKKISTSTSRSQPTEQPPQPVKANDIPNLSSNLNQNVPEIIPPEPLAINYQFAINQQIPPNPFGPVPPLGYPLPLNIPVQKAFHPFVPIQNPQIPLPGAVPFVPFFQQPPNPIVQPSASSSSKVPAATSSTLSNRAQTKVGKTTEIPQSTDIFNQPETKKSYPAKINSKHSTSRSVNPVPRVPTIRKPVTNSTATVPMSVKVTESTKPIANISNRKEKIKATRSRLFSSASTRLETNLEIVEPVKKTTRRLIAGKLLYGSSSKEKSIVGISERSKVPAARDRSSSTMNQQLGNEITTTLTAPNATSTSRKRSFLDFNAEDANVDEANVKNVVQLPAIENRKEKTPDPPLDESSSEVEDEDDCEVIDLCSDEEETAKPANLTRASSNNYTNFGVSSSSSSSSFSGQQTYREPIDLDPILPPIDPTSSNSSRINTRNSPTFEEFFVLSSPVEKDEAIDNDEESEDDATLEPPIRAITSPISPSSISKGKSVSELFIVDKDEVEGNLMDKDEMPEEFKELINTIPLDEGLEKVVKEKVMELQRKYGRNGTPKDITCTLMEHQINGLAWLIVQEEKNLGSILADDMGLGKTIQAISLMVARPPPATAENRTTLIVAPLSLLSLWKEEIKSKCSRGKFSVLIHHGADRVKHRREFKKYDIVITTYGTLLNDLGEAPIIVNGVTISHGSPNGVLLRMQWYRVILDEAHLIRNKDSKSSLAAEALRTEYRLCLTGTPVQNSAEDLYALFRFIELPNYKNFKEFHKDIGQYLNPKKIAKGEGPRHFSENAKEQAIGRLQVVLRGCLLRRTKETKRSDGRELITLRAKDVVIEQLKLTADEKSFYDMLEKRTAYIFGNYVAAGTVWRNFKMVLTWLLQLRQACNHPHLIRELFEEKIAKKKNKSRKSAIKDLILATKSKGKKAVKNNKRRKLLGDDFSESDKAEESDCDLGGFIVIDDHESDYVSDEDGVKVLSTKKKKKQPKKTKAAKKGDDILKEFGISIDSESDDEIFGKRKSTGFVIEDQEELDEDDRLEFERAKMFFEPAVIERLVNGVNDEKDDAKECPMCLDEHDDPLVTSCGHIFCRGCITEFVDDRTKDIAKVDLKAQVECMVCRSNFYIKCLVPMRIFMKKRSKIVESNSIIIDDEIIIDDDDDNEDNNDDGEDMDLINAIAESLIECDPEMEAALRISAELEAKKGSSSSSSKTSQPLMNSRRGVNTLMEQSEEWKRRQTQQQEEINQLQVEMRRLLFEGGLRGNIKSKDGFISSTKVNFVIDTLRDTYAEDPSIKTVIFSQWTKMLDIVEVALDIEEIEYTRLDGEMKLEERDEAIARLRDDKTCRVMLVSLKCGGVGLNLISASRAILLDLSWNPAIENQAIDRIHRIGQMKDVKVHRITIPDTIEDRILSLQECKQWIADGALGDGEIQIGTLTKKELMFLFNMKKYQRHQPVFNLAGQGISDEGEDDGMDFFAEPQAF